jgi:hypothetical protein
MLSPPTLIKPTPDQNAKLALAAALAEVIADWDITDGAAPFAITAENVESLPAGLLIEMRNTILRHRS